MMLNRIIIVRVSYFTSRDFKCQMFSHVFHLLIIDSSDHKVSSLLTET